MVRESANISPACLLHLAIKFPDINILISRCTPATMATDTNMLLSITEAKSFMNCNIELSKHDRF